MSSAWLEEIRALGVAEGDTLMLHVSLRKLGATLAGTQGGAAEVIAAIDEAVGPDGTWMMILGGEDPWDWVNRPGNVDEEHRAALLGGSEPFRSLERTALGEVGVLAELMRTTPGTEVNDHPEGRFAARGARARDLLDPTPWDDYYGPGSALERFVEWGGKVLRLGADPETVTVLHYAEYLADVAHPRRVARHRYWDGPNGPEIVVVRCLDDEAGLVDLPGEDYFARIVRLYLAEGRALGVGTVGSTTAELLDAADLVGYGAAWMSRHLRP